MGFQMPHIAIIVGLVCIGVAFIFQIVGVAATGWAVGERSFSGMTVDVEYGLWSGCSGSSCASIDDGADLPDWFEAVRAFAIIGLLVIVGCLVVAILIMFMENQMLPMIAAILAFVAAFCLLIEFAVYAGEREEFAPSEVFDLGYCFALTVVGFLLCIAAGICFIVPKFLG
ncbi:hypothetical protein BaRGS_00038063 [Batillaria attramentaria]|uniref:Uncharacterized protein n=1 Tax=Batillaria attramentaria TaxID=370345 RepID=A0ABD0J729_9CAEN